MTAFESLACLKLGDPVTVWLPHPQGLTVLPLWPTDGDTTNCLPLVPATKCISEYVMTEPSSTMAKAAPSESISTKFIRIQGTLLEVREVQSSNHLISSALEALFQYRAHEGGGKGGPAASLVAYVRFRQEDDNRSGAWVPLSLVTVKITASANVPPAISNLWEMISSLTSRFSDRDGNLAKNDERNEFNQQGPQTMSRKSSVSTNPLPIRAPTAVLSRVPYEPIVSPEIGQQYVENKGKLNQEGSAASLTCQRPRMPNVDKRKSDNANNLDSEESPVHLHPLFVATANYLKQCIASKVAVDFLESRLSRDFRSPPSQCRFFLYLMVNEDDKEKTGSATEEPPLTPSQGAERNPLSINFTEDSTRSTNFADGFAFPPWYYSPIHLLYGGQIQMGPLNPTDGIAEAFISSMISTSPVGDTSALKVNATSGKTATQSGDKWSSFVLGSLPPTQTNVDSDGGVHFGSEVESAEKDKSHQRSSETFSKGIPTFLPHTDNESLVSAAVRNSLAAHRSHLVDLHLCPFTLRLFHCKQQHHRSIDKLVELRLQRELSIRSKPTTNGDIGEEKNKKLPPCAYPLCPPGDEIYRDTNRGISVYFMVGNDHRTYVRNVFLLTKSFLENKLVGHDVALYNVYAVCLHTRIHFPRYHRWLVRRAEDAILRRQQQQQNDKTKSHACQSTASTRRLAELLVANSCAFAGFYSTEEGGMAGGYNLACIMSLPCFGWDGSVEKGKQTTLASSPGKGLGTFIIRLSYEIAYRKGYLGTPERPLSDLGEKAYTSYWRSSILEWMRRVMRCSKMGDLEGLSAILGKDFLSEAAKNGTYPSASSHVALSLSVLKSKGGGGARAATGIDPGRPKKKRIMQSARRRSASASSNRSSNAGSDLSASSSSYEDEDDGNVIGKGEVEILSANKKSRGASISSTSTGRSATAKRPRAKAHDVGSAGDAKIIIDLTSEDLDEKSSQRNLTSPFSSLPTHHLILRGLSGETNKTTSAQLPLLPSKQHAANPALLPPLRTSVEAISQWTGISSKDVLSALTEMGVFHVSAGDHPTGYSGAAATSLSIIVPADVVDVPLPQATHTATTSNPTAAPGAGTPTKKHVSIQFDPHCFLL